MNINLAINNGAKILKDRFISNPYLDSEILMAKTINNRFFIFNIYYARIVNIYKK